MRALRPALLAVGVGCLCAASSSFAAGPAPTGLHGFLLRADEPAATSFHRTPSFAWNPIAGARGYQLQLSTSSAFRDNGVLYNDATLPGPVAAPSLTLPWITGSPHSLYARVRALFPNDVSRWSATYGFDVVPPAPPTPLPAYPGVLRWTPVEGADAYEVWLVDAGKHEFVRTNVLDEREFYTFHQSQQWIGTVRWRIRALRGDQFNQRLNGIPVATSAAWSPIYSSTNPPPTSGSMHLIGTVSDIFSDGSPTSGSHALMPAFLWSGNQTLSGAAAELFRVEVFTDRQCLNRVYTGAVVGSPAWAPRLTGTLALPTDSQTLAAARAGYLADGKETADYAFDGDKMSPEPVEQQAQATPTTAVPGDTPAFPGTAAPGSTAGGSGSSGSSSSSTGGGPQGTTVSGSLGPPIGLWDVDWPQSGYYWTVIPVDPVDAGGSIQYVDAELPQDACAAGRVQRLGISSEPSLTSAEAPFATGLSSNGRLTSAAHTSKFYGNPLVAWTPAFDADVYEVQYSKTKYPFEPQTDPRSKTTGFLTFSTSDVLPLTTGTWYYRVRGIDYNLPTGVQQMSWSNPQKLVVSPPVFKVTQAKPVRRFKVLP